MAQAPEPGWRAALRRLEQQHGPPPPAPPQAAEPPPTLSSPTQPQQRRRPRQNTQASIAVAPTEPVLSPPPYENGTWWSAVAAPVHVLSEKICTRTCICGMGVRDGGGGDAAAHGPTPTAPHVPWQSVTPSVESATPAGGVYVSCEAGAH